MKRYIIYDIVAPILTVLYKILFFSRTKNKHNVPKTGGFIISGNHSSNLDAPLFAAVLPRNIRFLSKKELFANKFTNWFFTNAGCVPVDRGASEVSIFKLVVKLLKEGNVVSVFPEGTRHCKSIDDVKSGAVLFAIKARVPILPTAIIGKFRLFSGVKVVFGEPKYYDEYYDKKMSAEQLHELSVELIKEIYAIVENG